MDTSGPIEALKRSHFWRSEAFLEDVGKKALVAPKLCPFPESFLQIRGFLWGVFGAIRRSFGKYSSCTFAILSRDPSFPETIKHPGETAGV